MNVDIKKIGQRAFRIFAIAISLLTVLHVVFYFVSNYAIKKIETKTIDECMDRIPGRLIDVNGNRVHIVEKGDGEAVVFIHGFAGSTANWEETIYHDLPDNRRTICMDLFGMGFSERRDAFPYGFQFWAEQLRDTLNALQIQKASIVGFSLGGSVAVMFSAKYPERVERLVLISSLSPFEWTDLPLRFLGYYIPGGSEIMLTMPPLFSSKFMKGKARRRYQDIISIVGTRHALLRFIKDVPDFRGLYRSYPKIEAKTLLIHGEHDAVIPLSAIKRVAKKIPFCCAIYLEDIGHWVLGEAPHRLVAELAMFLYRND